jgi:hypothetical protein
MTDRRLRFFVRLALPLALPVALAFACCGGRAAVQGPGAQNANARPSGPAENCAKLPELVNAAYMHVIEHPMPADKSEATLAKLGSGELSMKGLVGSLVLSGEYRERFVSKRPAEEAAQTLYRHLMARAATPAELKAASAQLAAKDGFDAFARGLLDSKEYAMRFGESGAPGLRAQPCRFPFNLKQEDSFDGGRSMTTEATVEADGSVRATTVVKVPSPDKPFCGKVGLWLFDEAGRVISVVGPPREQQWCIEGKAKTQGEQQRTEEWTGTVPADLARHAASVALLQRPANNDPQAMSRENTERAQQLKRPLRQN